MKKKSPTWTTTQDTNTGQQNQSLSSRQADYLEFLRLEEQIRNAELNPSHPDAQTTKKLLQSFKRHIEPSLWLCLAKFLPWSLGAGFLSLFICPQFGLTPYDLQPQWMAQLLHQNMFVCGIYCGGVLYGFLLFGAHLGLNHYERVAIQKRLPWVPFALVTSIVAIPIAILWAMAMMAPQSPLLLSSFASLKTILNSHYFSDSSYLWGWFLAVLLGLIFGLYRGHQLQSGGDFEKPKNFAS